MRFISCHNGKLQVLGTQAFRATAARAFIYPPALANHGIALTHLFLARAREPRDLLWSIFDALRCKGVAAVVAATSRFSRVAARRLQFSAERDAASAGLTKLFHLGWTAWPVGWGRLTDLSDLLAGYEFQSRDFH
jgi:hypothetical protein